MRNDLTDVTVIIDRSGSMNVCRQEAENGINTFVEDQRKQEGECIFSLVQFDTEYEFVHKGVPISEVPKYKLSPRGMTALLDAVGRAINETGERLNQMNESDRPALVIMVIVTDGQENSSHEFTKQQIKGMIETQQSQYNWQFTFLGANQDAFGEAAAMGINANATANYDVNKTAAAFGSISSAVTRSRSAAKAGADVTLSYSGLERKSMTE